MLFNSLSFLIFFPLVVMAFFAMPHRYRNLFLLAASYYFYMCWKAEYVILIMASTLVDYFAALQMGKMPDKTGRKKYLVLSIVTNLSILFFFKYANFFNDSLRVALDQFNIFYGFSGFSLLLPVGISFYTFQSLSYSIDVYRGEKKPERNVTTFALYVAFFPQLVAGPIERSVHLLPQFEKKIRFNYEAFISGFRLILWGFFKKLVIADRLAIYVNEVYQDPAGFEGLTLLIATYFFAIQIYCDFSGYSDIAIGAARILGYDLRANFRQPYFSKSIAEFWRRWHISLSGWFKDYLYIPLGGNRVVKWRWYYNLMIVFLVSGLWHGANWTFVAWGFLHGMYLVVALITQNTRNKVYRFLKFDAAPTLVNFCRMMVTFHLVAFAWIFFRADSITDAFLIIQNLFILDFSPEGLMKINIENLGWGEFIIAWFTILFLIIIDLIDHKQKRAALFLFEKPGSFRLALDYALLFGIVFFGVFEHAEFIYFQF